MNDCEGILFRGHRSTYFNESKIIWKEELRILKKKSCDCDSCRDFLKLIQDHIDHDGIFIFPKYGIERRGIYKIEMCNIDSDEFDLRIVEVKEPKDRRPIKEEHKKWE